MSKKGVSDLIGTIPGSGRALFWEVKVPGKHPSPEQETFLNQMREAGALASVVTSPEEAIALLRAADYEPAKRLWVR